MYTPRLITDRDEWNTGLAALPHAHFLQTWEWGDFKANTTGWNPQRFAYLDANDEWAAAASVLTRRIAFLRVVYVPKGPALNYDNETLLSVVLNHLQKLARGAVWLKIDPDVLLGTGVPDAEDATENPTGQRLRETLLRRKWRFSDSQVQLRNTLLSNLSQSEDDLLAAMNQSTRRKVRKAEKAGVVVREADLDGDDLETLYHFYNSTSDRQDFLIRPLEYYREAWLKFTQAGLGHAFITEVEGEPVSGAVVFHFGQKAFYFYGMSSDKHRDANPNHLLQWHIMRWAKSEGYPIYDWWGAPNEFVEDDPLWGVYRFKDGFGAQVARYMGAWDYVPLPPLYFLYEQVMPRVLGFLKNRP